jgi:predicted nucleic acid-binding protein
MILISPELALNAGLLHAEMKKKVRNFGLNETILLLVARRFNIKIVTIDQHFKNFKETIYLR